MTCHRNNFTVFGNAPRIVAGSGYRGAAMMEMVMVLPLIITVLVLMWFLGTRLELLQHTEQHARLRAWRQVHADTGRTREANYEVVQRYVTDVTAEDQAAGDLLDEMLDRFPANLHASSSADATPTMPLLSGFEASFSRDHERIDRAWWEYYPGLTSYEEGGRAESPLIHGNTMHYILRDAFFQDFDNTLGTMADSGNDWAEAMQDFYQHWPGYEGPRLPAWVEGN